MDAIEVHMEWDPGSMRPTVVIMRDRDGNEKPILRVPLREVFERTDWDHVGPTS